MVSPFRLIAQSQSPGYVEQKAMATVGERKESWNPYHQR